MALRGEAARLSMCCSSRELPLPEGEDEDGVKVVERWVWPKSTTRWLEAAGDRDVWVVGGGNVASQYVDEGLLDEVLVTVTPVVLGKGKPISTAAFPAGRCS